MAGMNPESIENHLALVLGQWMIIIACAWCFGRAGRRIGQPLAVGEIVAGLALGPSGLGALWPGAFAALFPPGTQQSMQLLGKLGLIFLLFQVGMEFDYAHLRSQTRMVVAVALAGIVFPLAGGWLIGPWLHRTFAPQAPYFGFQLFVCVAMAITALPMMGRILLEFKLERTALGAIAISAAAIDDVVGWILLALITALCTAGFAWRPLLAQVLGLLLFFAAIIHAVGPALRWCWRALSREGRIPMPDSFLALLLTVLFGACLATKALGVFSIFGAFMLGVSLHREVRLVAAWRERFASFAMVALVPIFFTNTGLRTEIGSLAGPVAWLGCALVFAVAVLGKLGGCFLGARLMGVKTREAACVAGLMNTRALMGLIAINVGADLGLLPKSLFTMFVLMALGTTAMTGPLLQWWQPAALRETAGPARRPQPAVPELR
jgi:Kef-type K+ transport system membrane component KefB